MNSLCTKFNLLNLYFNISFSTITLTVKCEPIIVRLKLGHYTSLCHCVYLLSFIHEVGDVQYVVFTSQYKICLYHSFVVALEFESVVLSLSVVLWPSYFIRFPDNLSPLPGRWAGTLAPLTKFSPLKFYLNESFRCTNDNCTHMDLYTIAPLTFMEPSFAPPTSLSHFLDKGLPISSQISYIISVLERGSQSDPA